MSDSLPTDASVPLEDEDPTKLDFFKSFIGQVWAEAAGNMANQAGITGKGKKVIDLGVVMEEVGRLREIILAHYEKEDCSDEIVGTLSEAEKEEFISGMAGGSKK